MQGGGKRASKRVMLSPPVADAFSCGSDVLVREPTILALSLKREKFAPESQITLYSLWDPPDVLDISSRLCSVCMASPHLTLLVVPLDVFFLDLEDFELSSLSPSPYFHLASWLVFDRIQADIDNVRMMCLMVWRERTSRTTSETTHISPLSAVQWIEVDKLMLIRC